MLWAASVFFLVNYKASIHFQIALHWSGAYSTCPALTKRDLHNNENYLNTFLESREHNSRLHIKETSVNWAFNFSNISLNAHAALSTWVQVWRLVTRLLISISCANIFENILVSICRLYVDVMKDKFLKKSLRPIISLTKYWHNSSTSSGILFWVISVDRVLR